MQQIKYIIQRILQMVPVLIIISIIIFFSVRLIPGDPAVLMLGSQATEENVEAMRTKMGLDRPVYQQYLIYLKQLLHFDFGTSITLNKPVLELFLDKAAVTLLFTIMTTFFSLLISFPLGYFAGKRAEKKSGKAIVAFSLVAISIPEFWMGIILLLVFALKIPIFPVGGWGNTWTEHIRAMVLPALTGCIGTASLLTRNIQNNVVNVMNKDYVDFAYSKGIKPSVIRNRYVLKNVMVSTITLLSIRVATMLGGSVIIETVFALPGVGSMLMQAVLKRDYPLIQGIVLLFAIVVLLLNLITDISYSFLDPRVKLH